MTMKISVVPNGLYTDSMQAVGDSANDVFVATSEWAWQLTPYGPYYGELSWNIAGGGGNDHLTAGDEGDTVSGGDGNDTLLGLDGADILRGDDGNDQLFGGAMGDTLVGGKNNDWLDGGTGDDVLWGDVQDSYQPNEVGNDTLVGGAGADTMRGGNGNDVYYVDNVGDVVDEASGKHWVPHSYDYGGTWIDGSNGTDTVIEGLPAYTLPALVEIGQVNTAWGGASNLTGNELNNTLMGAAGNDTLNGGAGNDVMKGGTGNDIYMVTSLGDQVIEFSNEGLDMVQSYLSAYTLPANVENVQLKATANANATGNALGNTMTGNLFANVMNGLDGNDTIDGFFGNDILSGGNGDDVLLGSFGDDQLLGDAGNDSLDGGPGLDLIYGGTGNDTMFGDAGSDQLFGDAGNEVLLGGAGKDFLTGGAGSDIFKFNATSESTTVAFDVIQDFVKGVDKIDLSSIDANSLLAGNQAFTFNAAKPFFTSAGDLWVEQGRGFSSVYVDVNGDGNADMRIDLMGTMTLSAADFSL